MMRIFCFLLQTNRALLSPIPASSLYPMRLTFMDTLASVPGLVHIFLDWHHWLACSLSGVALGRAHIILKIIELDLSCHCRPRVPLFGGSLSFRLFTGTTPQDLGSCQPPLSSCPAASSLLSRGKHHETSRCPCLTWSRLEELTLCGALIGQWAPSDSQETS